MVIIQIKKHYYINLQHHHLLHVLLQFMIIKILIQNIIGLLHNFILVEIYIIFYLHNVQQQQFELLPAKEVGFNVCTIMFSIILFTSYITSCTFRFKTSKYFNSWESL
eukprot:UN05469